MPILNICRWAVDYHIPGEAVFQSPTKKANIFSGTNLAAINCGCYERGLSAENRAQSRYYWMNIGAREKPPLLLTSWGGEWRFCCHSVCQRAVSALQGVINSSHLRASSVRRLLSPPLSVAEGRVCGVAAHTTHLT